MKKFLCRIKDYQLYGSMAILAIVMFALDHISFAADVSQVVLAVFLLLQALLREKLIRDEKNKKS